MHLQKRPKVTDDFKNKPSGVCASHAEGFWGRALWIQEKSRLWIYIAVQQHLIHSSQ